MWDDSSGGWWKEPGLGSAGEEALAGFAHASPASSIDRLLGFSTEKKMCPPPFSAGKCGPHCAERGEALRAPSSSQTSGWTA